MKANLLTSFLIAAALFVLGAGMRDAREQAAAGVKPVNATPADLVVLPTILVVPSAHERAEAMLDEVADRYGRLVGGAELAYSDEDGGGSALTPRMNFDMPYYSFGKVLPRVSRK